MVLKLPEANDSGLTLFERLRVASAVGAGFELDRAETRYVFLILKLSGVGKLLEPDTSDK